MAEIGVNPPDRDQFGLPRAEPPSLLPQRDQVASYTIRVDLDGSRPKIWRRIVVPSDLWEPVGRGPVRGQTP